jgi:hypothetical protein
MAQQRLHGKRVFMSRFFLAAVAFVTLVMSMFELGDVQCVGEPSAREILVISMAREKGAIPLEMPTGYGSKLFIYDVYI